MACCAIGRSALVGILNGVDYEEWNTTNNPYLTQPYSAEDLDRQSREQTRAAEGIWSCR